MSAAENGQASAQAASPTATKFDDDLKARLKGLTDNRERAKELVEGFGGPEGIATLLATDITTGLPGREDDLARRRGAFGWNKLPPPPQKSFMHYVWEAADDRILIMLMIASLVSLIVGTIEDPEGGWFEGVAIIVAVLIVVLFTAVNDFQRELQFRALNELKEGERKLRVIRGNIPKEIPVDEAVVGDLVTVTIGDIMSVDGVYVQGSNVKVDESSATGESDAVKKSLDRDPLYLSGGKVIDGEGTMIVTAVGVDTFYGKIAMALRKSPDPTPLQERLANLADYIGKIGIAAAVFTFCSLFVAYFLRGGRVDGEFPSAVVNFVLTTITIVVVAVPEGLPLAVTMALAYSMKKMTEDQNLVRHLAACETMGSATAVCTDKTGTLTKNVMTVVRGLVAGHDFDEPRVTLLDVMPKTVMEVWFASMALNSTAFKNKGEYVGSKTETALLKAMDALQSDPAAVKAASASKLKKAYPFSSARKRMATVYELEPGVFRLFSKGASEIILSKCSNALDKDGEVVPLTDEIRAQYQAAINTYAKAALRTICMAYVDIPDQEDWEIERDTNMTLVGLVGIQDPLRDEVVEAVKDLHNAGVVIRMVTGDNLVTAKNIAKNAGIFNERGRHIALEGPQFRRLTDPELDALLPHLRVLARSSPLDKQRLVQRLKDLGEVVAVTGDGTNDAPALTNAHVGFAMGIAGTDVAKDAADIILMDDNFASIVKAVMWGRNVFDAIRKFIQFQLTVNFTAVIAAYVGSITAEDGHSPLTPVQLLWVNLIMDTLAALALATEKPTRALLNRPPVRKTDHLITNLMWRNIFGQGVYQLLVLFYILWGVPGQLNVTARGDVHLTIFFNTFVLLQLFNEINARRINGEMNVFEGIFGHTIFLMVKTFTFGAQVLIVQVAVIGAPFSAVPLSFAQWMFCIMLAILCLPVGAMIRLIPTELPDDTVGGHVEVWEDEERQGWAKAQEIQMKLKVVSAFRRPGVKKQLNPFG